MAMTLQNGPANRFDQVDLHMAKADAKKLGSWDSQIGQVIDYAISLSNRTQREVWEAMGANDGSDLSKWIAGTRTPDFARLFAIDWLRQPLVIAFAGLANAELTTQITFRRSA